MELLNFIPSLPESKNMKRHSLVALCIVVFACGAACAEDQSAGAVVQRVVAAIKTDIASEFDCVADDDLHRFRAPPAAATATPVSSSGLAAAAKQDRARMARIERQLRTSPTAR
jgi:hypothetical protein